MKNLNCSFNGGLDIEEDIFAYIDESGDDGFKFDSGCSNWFVVGGCVATANEMNLMIDDVKEFSNTYAAGKPITRCSFKKLSHTQRRNVLGSLKSRDYQAVCSTFYKKHIDPTDAMCTYPSMYFVGIKNVVERLSWLAQQQGKRYVHILISNRSSINSDELKEYLFTNSRRAQKNMTYFNRVGLVAISTENNHNKLLFGDYVASCMYQALEVKDDSGTPQADYAQIFLKNKMYSSSHPTYGGVWRNGLKITPDNKDLIFDDSILQEGSHR